MAAQANDLRLRAAHIALALTPGIGPARFAALVAAFQNPLGAIRAPLAGLRAVPGMSRAAASAVKHARLQDGVAVLARAERLGGAVLLLGDDGFPTILTQIPDPPPVLFVHGRRVALDGQAVAIVGSRDHTAYGSNVCRTIADSAARAGLTVISGMARGLDAVAHQAALDAGGFTIGVLGNGLGVVYPAAHRELYERVAAEGLLVTEFPPGERPRAGSFPRRNRLISGLAAVTVVVEAARGSGTLITVGCALEQGREVMAVPGNITTPTSAGTNLLIRDGATPLLHPDDLLGMFQGLPASAPRAAVAVPPMLPPVLQGVYDALGPTPLQVDELADRLGQPVATLLATLATLELAGAVVQRPGHLFARAH